MGYGNQFHFEDENEWNHQSCIFTFKMNLNCRYYFEEMRRYKKKLDFLLFKLVIKWSPLRFKRRKGELVHVKASFSFMNLKRQNDHNFSNVIISPYSHEFEWNTKLSYSFFSASLRGRLIGALIDLAVCVGLTAARRIRVRSPSRSRAGALQNSVKLILRIFCKHTQFITRLNERVERLTWRGCSGRLLTGRGLVLQNFNYYAKVISLV